jgi:hypothetical protein
VLRPHCANSPLHSPLQPSHATKPPGGDAWLHEIKLEGCRLRMVKDRREGLHGGAGLTQQTTIGIYRNGSSGYRPMLSVRLLTDLSPTKGEAKPGLHVRILIADDHAVVRSGLRTILARRRLR